MDSHSLVSGHPRLWISPGELRGFAEKSLGFRRRWRQALLRTAGERWLGPGARAEFIAGDPALPALALGQAWRLTGDEDYGRAAEVLLEALDPFVAANGSYDAWGMAAEAAACLYDWLHDYWRRRGRERDVAEVAILCGRRALDDFLHRYIVDDWHNYALGLQAGALAAALAVGFDHPDLENGALLRDMRRLHFTGYRYEGVRIQDAYRTPPTVCCLDAALRSNGGAGFACLGEATGGYHAVDAWEAVKFAELWTRALRPKARGGRLVWPEVVRAGEAILHTFRPDGRNVVVGDSHPNEAHQRQADILRHIHARTPRPEFAEWLREWNAAPRDEIPAHALLSGTQDSLPRGRRGAGAAARPAIAALPAAERFGPLVAMRSGWDPDATLVTFRCGQHGGWHNHLDHNGFTIYRGGALALDSGSVDYVNPHRPEYAMRTVAHNCILVRNRREKSWYGRFGKESANDGGQRLVTLSHVPPNASTGGPHAVLTEDRRRRLSDEFDMGRILAFAPGKVFDYVAGDATRAYTYPWSGIGTNPSRRVEEAVRQIVFVKPDWVIVFDRVEATRKEHEKKWLLHSVAAPACVDGRTRRLARPGIRRLPGDGPYAIEHGRGRLTVWPLLPRVREVRAIGGPGCEAWVEGAPGSDQRGGRNFAPPKAHAESGTWRIEISPARPAARDLFLVAMHVGLKGEGSPVGRCTIGSGSADGVSEIAIRARGLAGGQPIRVRFRESGLVEVEIEVAGERFVHRARAPERVRAAER